MSDRERLFDLWLHGGIEAADRAALADLLLRDPEAGRALVRHAIEDAMLGSTALELLATEAPRQRSQPLTRSRPLRPRQGLQGIARRMQFAAVLVVGLFAALLMWRAADAPPAHDDLRLIAVRGAASLDDRPLAVGSAVPAGVLRVPDAGEAVLRWPDGSTATLSDGELALAKGSAPALRTGRLMVEVVPQPPAQRLRIVVPGGVVEVVGTRFDLAVDGAITRLRVAAGRVRLASDGGDSAFVEAGDRARLSAGQVTTGLRSQRAPALASRTTYRHEKQSDGNQINFGFVRGDERRAWLRFRLPEAMPGERIAAIRLHLRESPDGSAGSIAFTARAVSGAFPTTWRMADGREIGRVPAGQLSENQRLSIALDPGFGTAGGEVLIVLEPLGAGIDHQFIQAGRPDGPELVVEFE